MGLPTLLKKGTLRPGMGEKQKDLDDKIAIDYIMDWFGERINNISKIKKIDDKVIILESQTGSGKSTTFPTELFLRFGKVFRGSIVVTQPRVLTAISIPNTIASIDAYKKENRTDGQGIEFGKNIGYATKEYVKKPLERGILFCTIGVLLQYLKNMNRDIFLNKYKFIILDEAHDRSINLDIIFYYLKQMLKTIPLEKCPFIIITSATLDVNKYATYFNTKTIFKVSGTSYPITDNYLKYDSDNIITSTINMVKNIHEENDNDDIENSDIVIFIPSKSFIKKIKSGLLELNNSLERKIIPIALDSAIYKESGIDYQNIFSNIKDIIITDENNKKQKPTRKVIIGTNAIETGITIESLKYCIDTGLVNQLEYDPVNNTSILSIKPVTKAMSQQRRGRVGRVHPGIFYPMYSVRTFNSLLEIQHPEILINDISTPLLNIIIIKYTDVINKYMNEDSVYDKLYITNNEYDDIKFLKNIDISKMELLDNPSNIAVTSSLEKLYITGAIFANGYPTKLGLLINRIRLLSIENIRMILSGYYHGCNISDLITIACFIQTSKQNITSGKFKLFNNKFNDSRENIDSYNYNKLKSRLFISCEFIDFLLFFYKFKIVVSENIDNIQLIKEFCEENKVNYASLMLFIETRDEILKDFLFNMNMNPFHNNHINLYSMFLTYNSNNNTFNEFIEEVMKIKSCIYEGYKLNTATYNKEKDVYISDYNNHIINSDSYLLKNMPVINNGEEFLDKKPSRILYDSLIVRKNINDIYEYYVSNAISVLCGYVNIDNDIF